MIKRKRGRPKGSKNKPKPEAKKRGRPRKEAAQKTVYPMVDGISLVRRAPGSNKENHRFVVCPDNEVIGYYKSFNEALKVMKEYDK